jgi:hypothetical protein
MQILKLIRQQTENLCLFALVMVIFGFYAFLDIDYHHDGLMLKTAMDVAEGQVIFRDTFNQYGALTTFIQALAIKLFGAELLTIRLATVFFYGLSILWLNKLCKLILTRPFRYLVLIFFLGLAPFYEVTLHPWSSVYALFFMLVAEERMLVFLRNGRCRDLFWVGLATAGAFGCRHPCGMVILLAGLLALGMWSFLNRPGRNGLARAWGAFAAGVLAPLTVFALWLLYVGAWDAYLLQAFGFTARFAVKRGGGSWADISEALFPFLSFFWVFPLASLGMLWYSTARFFKGGRNEPAAYLTVFALLMYGLASWHQFFPVPCVRHLYWGSIPMFPVLALLAERLWRRTAWPKPKRVVLLALLLFVPLSGVCYRLLVGSLRVYYAPNRVMSDVPGARGMLIFPSAARMLKDGQVLFNKLPPELKNRPYLNYTEDGFFSVLFPSRRNLHPMSVNWRDNVYPDYSEAVGKQVQEYKPVILSKQYPVDFPGYQVFEGFRLMPAYEEIYLYINVPADLMAR